MSAFDGAHPAHQAWQVRHANAHAALLAEVENWRAAVAKAEDVFQTNLYRNPGADHTDYRYHRCLIYDLLSRGEWVVIRLTENNARGSDEIVELMEAKLRELSRTLYSWHGPLEEQRDVPETFKQAVQDVAAGRVTSLRPVLQEAVAQ